MLSPIMTNLRDFAVSTVAVRYFDDFLPITQGVESAVKIALELRDVVRDGTPADIDKICEGLKELQSKEILYERMKTMLAPRGQRWSKKGELEEDVAVVEGGLW